MSEVIGAPVVELVAARGEGVGELKEIVNSKISEKLDRDRFEVSLKDRFNKSQELLSKIVVRPIERDRKILPAFVELSTGIR